MTTRLNNSLILERTGDSCQAPRSVSEHRRIQEVLATALFPCKIILEFHIPAIGRIADLFWPEEKLVIEVQRSPITPEEILGREADYAQVGYQVLWILDERQFRQWRPSPAEQLFARRPHYWVGKRGGQLLFYDQLDLLCRRRRHPWSAPAPLQWGSPCRLPRPLVWFWKQRLPEPLARRLSFPYFRGDLIDRTLHEQGFLQVLDQKQHQLLPPLPKAPLLTSLARSARGWWEILLDQGLSS